MKNTTKSQSGFSLVEMAIVLVIIGLIVAAVAAGKDTMASAKNVRAYQKVVVPCVSATTMKKVGAEFTSDGFRCTVHGTSGDYFAKAKMFEDDGDIDGDVVEFHRIIKEKLDTVSDTNGNDMQVELKGSGSNRRIEITVTTPIQVM